MGKIKLGDLCNPNHGHINTKSDTIIDYIDISSVDNESKTVTGYQTMVFGEAPSRARKMVKRGNILVSTVRPNLNAVAMITDDTPNLTVASTGFCVLDCKKNVDKRFVFNYCKSKAFVDEMVSQATGASYPAVSDKIVRSAQVPEYSYDEQKRIGELLDKIALIVDLRKRELANLDELVKARFVEMFGDYHTNSKGFETHPGIELFKFSSGKFLPEEKRLSDGIPVYGGNGIAWYTDVPLIDYPTIIIGRVGALCGNIHTVQEPVWITDNAIYIKEQKTNKFTLEFLTEMMTIMDFYQYADFSGQPKITQKPLESLHYLTPPIEMQNEFTDFCKQVDKSKVAVQKALDETQLLFESLMQNYFG